MAPTPLLNYSINFVCIIGLGLSIYAYYVELNIERNNKYQAMCDISENISCTKAFKSEYGKGLGLFSKDSIFYKPNSLLAQSKSIFLTRFSYICCFIANLTSLYFAYILYFKLHDFCIVCVCTYIVNILTILLINSKLKALKIYWEEERLKRE